MGHRATLPHGFPYSTITDAGLNFGVRNGIRCFPCSKDTPNYNLWFMLFNPQPKIFTNLGLPQKTSLPKSFIEGHFKNIVQFLSKQNLRRLRDRNFNVRWSTLIIFIIYHVMQTWFLSITHACVMSYCATNSWCCNSNTLFKLCD